MKRDVRVGRRLVTLAIIGVLLTAIIASIAYALHIRQVLYERLSKGWFVPPVEFYARGTVFHLQQKVDVANLRSQLLAEGYVERQGDTHLISGEFLAMDGEACAKAHDLTDVRKDQSCLVISKRAQPFGGLATATTLVLDSDSTLARISPNADIFETEPQLFAQYFGEKLMLREITSLGQIPLSCLQAATAIEDSDFLQHRGVSFTGTLRALARNILEGRFAQGGSTITQQLVKNAFLTHRKTLGRKLNEQLMAILLEAQADKDQILQAYLNEIYMGQSGPLELRGMGAASHYYFNQPLSDLQLPQCALLAALINSPGRYSPFSHPEAAKKRRALVLDRMQKLNMISAEDQTAANAAPLPIANSARSTEPAPYVVNQLNQELKNLPHENGLRVLTSIHLQAQTIAQNSLRSELEALENQYASLKKKRDAGHVLEGALISLEVATGNIVALVGGRSYKQTQLNRVYESRRQIGSTVKPFIYLTALESARETFTPLTVLDDSPLEYHYQGQTWSPKNDDSKFRGKLPFYYALKESLNVPTARMGLSLGLDNIVEVLHRAGVDDPIELLPSLTLGAFEIKPIELAQAYLTIARMGSKTAPSLVIQVEDDAGNKLLDVSQRTSETVFKSDITARLLGMLENTLRTGTAKSSARLGFTGHAAGKTGTTSETKDAWFAGTTPEILTVVWVGYDDNEHVGLTGAYAALPIWTKFMTQAYPDAGATDFPWPDGMKPKHIDADDLRKTFDTLPDSESQGVDLIM